MKKIIVIIFALCFVSFFQSCSVYYDAKEQSVYIPNVVNQNITVEKKDFTNSLFIGFNHIENQTNYRAIKNLTLQSNIYLSKGFNLCDVGCSYSQPIKSVFYIDIAPGISFGDMGFDRERSYTEGTGGSSYDIYYKKNEEIDYHFYRIYLNPSFSYMPINNFRFSIGARLAYSSFQDFDYSFYNRKTYASRRPTDTLIYVSYQDVKLDRLCIEPYFSFYYKYKKVGAFLQVLYYDQIGSSINSNTSGIMTRSSSPILLSCGFVLNFNLSKKATQ